jgi:hypothetical protein
VVFFRLFRLFCAHRQPATSGRQVAQSDEVEGRTGNVGLLVGLPMVYEKGDIQDFQKILNVPFLSRYAKISRDHAASPLHRLSSNALPRRSEAAKLREELSI